MAKTYGAHVAGQMRKVQINVHVLRPSHNKAQVSTYAMVYHEWNIALRKVP
jgi:hypothetical protein